MADQADPDPQEATRPLPEDAVRRDPLPVLRQLSSPFAILAIAKDMEKAVVALEAREGDPERLAIIERSLAEEMTLRGWIACLAPEARVQRYRIAPKGKALLKEHMAALRSTPVPFRASGTAALRRPGFSEAPAAFTQPLDDDALFDDDRLHHTRAALFDTTLIALSRRRDEKGEAFLSREHVAAGERLREDFELAQQEDNGPADWEGFLERLWVVAEFPGTLDQRGVPSAGDRLRRALLKLGPGMADAAMRCCCLHEGVETIERRLGWSTRSGKVVLRIALWRLHQHHQSEDDRLLRMIG